MSGLAGRKETLETLNLGRGAWRVGSLTSSNISTEPGDWGPAQTSILILEIPGALALPIKLVRTEELAATV